MSEAHANAFVFFGATGDLAYKKIFPALQAMVAHGHLTVPVIGVANAGWTLDELRARAYESVVKYGPVNHSAFDKLARLMRYVDGTITMRRRSTACAARSGAPPGRHTTWLFRPRSSAPSFNSWRRPVWRRAGG
jgi:glucose-6-phosphate 1-dehydrogenase